MEQPLELPNFVPSTTLVDIVIPAIEKDLPALPFVVESALNFLKHPIAKIHIVAPCSEAISSLCKQLNINFVDESTVIPVSKNDINYISSGLDRSGWIFQQLLKLNADEYCEQENILILDADTVFIRPSVFKYFDKTIYFFSDEYHKPYYDAFSKLLNLYHRAPFSFVAHQMLFEKHKLKAMKNQIENIHQKPWYKAIIDIINPAEISCFSEYETYGNFAMTYYPNDAIVEYWHNLSMNRSMLPNLKEIVAKYAHRYRTISFHSYNS